VPGQVEYNASRKLILNGADGIIFVADSDPMRRHENVSALQNMIENLAAYDLSINSVPLVFQYNKRDLTNAMPLSLMETDLNPNPNLFPAFESVAADGPGVFATLKQASKLVLNRLQ
jgi:mutual gliding-motility protein MglA